MPSALAAPPAPDQPTKAHGTASGADSNKISPVSVVPDASAHGDASKVVVKDAASEVKDELDAHLDAQKHKWEQERLEFERRLAALQLGVTSPVEETPQAGKSEEATKGSDETDLGVPNPPQPVRQTDDASLLILADVAGAAAPGAHDHESKQEQEKEKDDADVPTHSRPGPSTASAAPPQASSRPILWTEWCSSTRSGMPTLRS